MSSFLTPDSPPQSLIFANILRGKFQFRLRQDKRLLAILRRGFSGVLIHQKLIEKGVDISYSGVKKYVRKLKGPRDTYVPIVSPPGKEAQVDFGYAGYFNYGGKKVNVLKKRDMQIMHI